MAHTNKQRQSAERGRRKVQSRAGRFCHQILALVSRLAHVPSAKPWLAYTVAVIATALATVVRWWLGKLVGETLPPFITYYPLVMFTALFGGTGPGLVAR